MIKRKQENTRQKGKKEVAVGVNRVTTSSRWFGIIAAFTLVLQTIAPAAVIAANEVVGFEEYQLEANTPSVTYNPGDGSFDVTLSGIGEAEPFEWSSLAYYMAVTWGDGTITYSDTPGSDTTDTFNTPDFGRTMEGVWEGDHAYTAPGTYNVVIDLYYNPDQPHITPVLVPGGSDMANDELRARISLELLLEIPPEPEGETSDGVTICVDDEGYHATVSGSETLSPFTWSSLGYYVRAAWGDGETTYSDTPSSGITDTFNTPDFGRTLVGDWTGTHTFATEGFYEIMVDLFRNPDQPHIPPVLVPENSDLSNDELKNTTVLGVNTNDAVPCNPPQQEEEPELPLDISIDDVDVCRDGETYQVTLSGMGGGSPFTWSSLAYYVNVNWGDGSNANSDTTGSDVSDTFHTPDFGRTLAGTWTGEHTYAGDGTHDVTVSLFRNPDQPHIPPVKVPAASNPGNDELVAMATTSVYVGQSTPECIGNPQSSADLTIQKVWVTDNETLPDISIFFASGLVILDPDTLSYDINSMPGQYSLTEDPVDGFTTDINCGSAFYNTESGQLTLEANDDVTCTITNTEIVNSGGGDEVATTTITIIKDWVPLESVSSSLPAFEISFDGEVVLSNVTGTSPIALTDVEEGNHTITETTVAGYTSSIACEQDNGEGSTTLSIDSEGNFSFNGNGEITCTVTNTETEGNVNGSGTGGGGTTIQSFGGGGGGNLTANNSVGGGGSGFLPIPQVLGVQDTAETILTCAEQYPEAALITGDLDDLLAAYGFTRNTGLEQTLTQTILPKIIPAGMLITSEEIISNFIVYGIQALLHLGGGERAGVIASFNLLYGQLPENECDWQNVIRIGQGVVPVVLSPEREAVVENAFQEIYDRAPNRADNADNITVLIMAYGLRPDVRSISAEIQANAIFRSVFGHFPGNTGEWDIMRGIAYGGITVPGFEPITP